MATLRTSYARTTLLLADVRAAVETKSGSARPGPLDRRLWALGHRPIRISKYGTGLALLSPDLPTNRWHRVTSRHLADHLTLRAGVLA